MSDAVERANELLEEFFEEYKQSIRKHEPLTVSKVSDAKEVLEEELNDE